MPTYGGLPITIRKIIDQIVAAEPDGKLRKASQAASWLYSDYVAAKQEELAAIPLDKLEERLKKAKLESTGEKMGEQAGGTQAPEWLKNNQKALDTAKKHVSTGVNVDEITKKLSQPAHKKSKSNEINPFGNR